MKKIKICSLIMIAMLAVGLCSGCAAQQASDRDSMQWAKELDVKEIEKIELVVMPSNENERYQRLSSWGEWEGKESLPEDFNFGT